jgi:hypothetical protein
MDATRLVWLAPTSAVVYLPILVHRSGLFNGIDGSVAGVPVRSRGRRCPSFMTAAIVVTIPRGPRLVQGSS